MSLFNLCWNALKFYHSYASIHSWDVLAKLSSFLDVLNKAWCTFSWSSTKSKKINRLLVVKLAIFMVIIFHFIPPFSYTYSILFYLSLAIAYASYTFAIHFANFHPFLFIFIACRYTPKEARYCIGKLFKIWI